MLCVVFSQYQSLECPWRNPCKVVVAEIQVYQLQQPREGLQGELRGYTGTGKCTKEEDKLSSIVVVGGG